MQAIRLFAFVLVFVMCLPGCRFHSEADPIALEGEYPIFYVKKKLDALNSPATPGAFVPGSDIFMRESASPSAREINITGILTKEVGAVGAPEPSFDGKQIVFALRCSSESSPRCSSDTTWNLWTYDIATQRLAPVIDDFTVRNLGDDTSPGFLPGRKIVFSSTRQQATRDRLGYVFTDQEHHGPASVLHTINEDGTSIEQISFNQSHDLNPAVMSNGQIVFARWDHIAERSKISIYKANPDGSDTQVYYGAHSPGDYFLHPRELEDKRLISTVMSSEVQWEGGALLTIDVQNYSDANAPAPNLRRAQSAGQQPASLHKIPLDNALSRGGRFTSPFPVLDGSNNVLVSYSLYSNATVLGSEAEEELQESRPNYGIYILNISDKSLRPLVLPENGFAFTDAVAAFPRDEPPILTPRPSAIPGSVLGSSPEGVINIKSIYDTDQLGRMGMEVLTAKERSTIAIPQTAPIQLDRREWVADIAKLKDPLQTSAEQRPARFLRVMRAQPSPPGLLPEAVGETNYGMRELVGYAPIEPDGSVKVKVPADVPLVLNVLDVNGRAFDAHTGWIQVRPGETLTCNGCHAPGRTAAINSAPIAGTHPNTSLRTNFGSGFGNAQGDETMAETRTRLDTTALELSKDIVFEDVWTDTFFRTPDTSFSYRYADLQTLQPSTGVINFPDHIQPIFNISRPSASGDNRCDRCHNGIVGPTNPSGLDLAGINVGVFGRTRAYDSLLVGYPVFDENNQPVYEDVAGASIIRHELPLVKPGYARGSYLVQKIFNEDLNAERGLPAQGMDHSSMLSPAEKKLIVEWIDLGAQYYNSPIDESGNLRTVAAVVSYDTYLRRFAISLNESCGECHRSKNNDGEPNPKFVGTRFIQTQDRATDFRLIADLLNVQNPTSSIFLTTPSSTTLHPTKGNGDPYLVPNSAFYNLIVDWISAGADDVPQTINLAVPYSRLKP